MKKPWQAQLPLRKGDYAIFADSMDDALLVGTKFGRLFTIRAPWTTRPSRRIVELKQLPMKRFPKLAAPSSKETP